MKSIYIHIPFCKHKCLYCDFNSFDNKENLIDPYIEALKKEISVNDIKDANTIYIGGGTPSVIDSKHIVSVLTMLPDAKEITIEINPGTITYEKLVDYRNAGINRISIGLQTTKDSILKEIGRIHSFKEFEDAYKLVREAGFENVNVDLMFGLPNQTLDDFKDSIQYLIKIKPEHISAYSLILHNDIFKNLPTDEEERNMYHYLVKSLKEAGYKHYEISNFSISGYESKHNIVYWNQNEYYGFGAGASSFLDNKRYTNISSIEKYIENINSGIDVRNMEEELSIEDKINEYMILKLRLIEGVNIEEANRIFNTDILKLYEKSIDKLLKHNLIRIDQNICLTEKGLDLANIVWEEFV